MTHPSLIAWEKKLWTALDRVDDSIEDKYGHTYPLHPSRPRRGTTSSKSHDGLFNLDTAFSAGFGSQHGAGYVVRVRLVTLKKVPAAVRARIEDEVADRLREELASVFPGTALSVERDGPVYKIHGNLRLGKV